MAKKNAADFNARRKIRLHESAALPCEALLPRVCPSYAIDMPWDFERLSFQAGQ